MLCPVLEPVSRRGLLAGGKPVSNLHALPRAFAMAGLEPVSRRDSLAGRKLVSNLHAFG